MTPRSLLEAIGGRIGGGPRRKAIVLGLILTLAAAAVIVPLSLSGPPSRTSILRAEGCASAPALDPPRSGGSSGTWSRVVLPRPSDCARLTPTDVNAGGVALNSAFVLTAAEPITAASLPERLSVDPAFPFDALQESPNRLRLVPKSPLTPGTLYRFALLDAPGGPPVRRWSYQAQSPVRVVQTLPRDRSTDVPLNVGIELTLSHDGVTGVRERFSISPETEGRFEIHKRVFVFVPKSLRPQTLYTVTLKPGARVSASTQEMTQPFTFRFETGVSERTGQAPGEPLVQFGRAVWESATAEPPVVSLFSTQSDGAPASLPFTVYRFADPSAFLESLGRFTDIPAWAGSTRTSFVAKTSGLSNAASFTGRLQRLGEEGDLFVRFPDALPAGFYLVTAEYRDVPIQTWLQVTDLATYAALSGDRTLVWVNDLRSKAPVSGATIRLAGGPVTATTGGDGVAAFTTPRDLLLLRPSERGEEAEVVGNLLVGDARGQTAVVPLADIFTGFHSFEFREYTFSGDPNAYWRFLYADRDLYRTSDTIRFWGLVRRRAGALTEQDVTLELVSHFGEHGPVTIARTGARTTARGTFIGELPFAGVAPGFYELTARSGDQVVASTSLQIEDFTKPAYKLDVVSSKKAVVSGDLVTFSVNASFFEGSPVPNLGLTYRLGDEDEPRSLTTDGQGGAVVRHRPTFPEIRFDPFQVFPALAEEAEIAGESSVQVFPSTLALEAAGTSSDGRARVDGTVFRVDFDRLNSETTTDVYDYRGAPAAGRQVTAVVTELSWRRIEAGETYDFTAKIVRKNYRYESVSRPAGRFSARSDSRGRFAISFNANEKRTYEVELRVADDARRVFAQTIYVDSGFDVFNVFPYLARLADGPYAVGDDVAVAMRHGESDLPSGGDNRYLFFKAANGIRDHSVGRSSRYSFRFTDAHIPNVDVMAVRFTGVTYQEASAGLTATFEHELRRLTVEVGGTKPRYRPGETAELAVRVTDSGGRPVRAEVLLSAVDEALYRVHPDSFFDDRDILETLYEPVPGGVLRAYASHQHPRTYGGAEMGGEGPDRTNFRDVGIFTRVTTGADGRARAPFKLPDNLTSWRITALAVTDSLQAGSALAPLPVGLPVFADVGLNDSYLMTDRPFARVRAFGSELRGGDRVEFRLEAPTLAPAPVGSSARAFEPIDIPLPPLKEGRHTISVRVSARGRSDTVVRTITVVPSRLLAVQASTQGVSTGGRLVPPGSDDRLTTVVLTDHNRGRYYPALERLSWTYGDRVDQMLARNLSQELLAKHFDEPVPFPAPFHPSAYQTEEGGISIFPFADDDLLLSARVAALVPDRFGRQELTRFFSQVLADRDSTSERSIIALYGLSALGEPVLLDVQRAAAEKDLTVRERLYVALAASELGDEGTARTAYRHLLDRYGEARGALIRLNVGKDRDDVLEATSLAAILGAWLGDDAAPAMFDYTSETAATDILPALEQISFLTEALPRLSGEPSRVTYTVAGKRETRDLARGQSVALSLTATGRSELNLEVSQGRVAVSTSFLAPIQPDKVRPDTDAGLTRTYDGHTEGPITLRDGDVVRISLDYRLGPKALDGCYQVTDLLPSGLRAVARPYARGIEDTTVSYPYAIEGQRVSFCVSARGRPLAYYARVIGRGTFTAEPALIQSQRGPERLTLTRSIAVEIR